MARINRKQIALIHVAKSRLGLGEEEYRNILAQFGVQSSKELDYRQFKELMLIFQKLGFERKSKRQKLAVSFHPVAEELNGQKAKGSPFTPITDKQKKKLWALWNTISRVPEDKREQALNSFCKRISKVDHWRWLDVGGAQKVITALEKMAEQEHAG